MYRIIVMLVLLFGVDFLAYAQAEDAQAEPIKSTLFYRNNEPKDLFSWLSETYYVQFEGADQVRGPLTLISKDMIDSAEMVALLNEVLSKQNLEATMKDRVVAIKRVRDSKDKTISLRYAEPGRVKTILDRLYTQTDSEGIARATLIEVHPNNTAIIVRGPLATIDEIEKYVKEQLDISGLPEIEKVETAKKEFNLVKLQVEETVEYLREVYLQTGANQLNKASLIVVVPNLSRIVVEGPAAVVDEIGRKLAEMEAAVPEVPVAPLKRKYVSLKYMDTEEFEKLLQNNEDLYGRYASLKAPNNILIISTREPEIFTQIDQMQETFDVDRMEIRYLRINHADPAGLAKLLTAIYPKDSTEIDSLPEELQRARRRMTFDQTSPLVLTTQDVIQDALFDAGFSGEPETAERLSRSISLVASGELTIVPDTERSGIIVRTFSRNFPKLLEIIEEIDQPRRQVFIDVFITQVSNDNKLDLGFDWNFTGDTERKGEVIPFELTQNFNAKLASTGLNYQIISDNLKLYLNAMEKSGKVDIISRPHLTTKDNSRAVITMGSTVPIVDKINVNSQGIASSSVVWRPVATVLDVTPKIHPDNYITLKIVQKVDAISAETVQISRDFNPNILINREASTELRVKDGQTICIGGFVGDEIIQSVEKVPLLGDIPLLGRLFSKTVDQRIKREMIIFITPHILTTPEDSLRMTNEARDNSQTQRVKDRDTTILDTQEELVPPRYYDATDPALR